MITAIQNRCKRKDVLAEYTSRRNLDGWQAAGAELKRFHRERPASQRAQLAYFGLDKTVAFTLHVEPPGAGRVRISSITPASMPWTGIYFDGNPLTVIALPAPGFVFSG